MKLELPHAEDTDGRMLQDFAVHSVIKDMITRRGTIHPKYGVVPQTYGMVGAGGFQVIRPILVGAEGLNRRGPAGSRLFLGPGFRLAACWNRLVETEKTRKERETTGKNGRDTA